MASLVDNILSGLDDSQKNAAQALKGPVRISAVAGAGKTRTITRRIAYGVSSGLWDPQRTVAVTFSVKAAGEMKQRLASLGVSSVTANTFHALALSQLRKVWYEVTDQYFPQLITDPSEILESSVEKETTLGGASSRELRDLLAEVNWTKISLIAPKEYARVCAAFHRIPPAGLSVEQMSSVIEDFERVKAERNLIDFNDILLILAHLIEESDEAAAMVRKEIGWLTVDEYQDVSPLQHKLMTSWLGTNTNVCVVGDPAQTIYSFAGATSYYLHHFDSEFGHLTADVRLDRDYRSTPQIVAAANKVLSSSPVASDYVPLISQSEQGDAVKTRVYANDETEAQGVAAAIKKLIESGIKPSEIAVLTRINAQMRPLTMAADALGIPAMVRQTRGEGLEENSFSQAVRTGVKEGIIESLNTAMVTFSTIHAAKGLEWDYVFIIGLSEGLLPFSSSADEEQVEEERRLLYVAITRGRHHVELSYARKKDENASFERAPSRFLKGH